MHTDKSTIVVSFVHMTPSDGLSTDVRLSATETCIVLLSEPHQSHGVSQHLHDARVADDPAHV